MKKAWFVLLLIYGCSCHTDQKKNRDSHAFITVRDFRNKEIVLEKKPGRIVCLMESALSGFYMLHAGDRIAGISSNVYDDPVFGYYALLDERIRKKSLPAPGNWDFISIENLVAVRPDLVVIWASQTEAIESIESKDIPVYAVMLNNLEDVYKEICDFGKITGTESRADSLVKYTRASLKEIREKSSKGKPAVQKVYFMWSQGPLQTSGTHSTVNELIELAGAKNACTLPDEHAVVNQERVVAWNPDVIVMWYNESKDPEDILKMPGWKNINAVKNKRVYELPSVFLCDLWTLKFRYAVSLLSRWCYPGESTAVDPEAEKRDMLKYLYGKEGGEME